MQQTDVAHGCVTLHPGSSRCASLAEIYHLAGYHPLVTCDESGHLKETNGLQPYERRAKCEYLTFDPLSRTPKQRGGENER